jgi:hypothetical protein
MNYQEALRKYKNGIDIRLPQHTGSGYVAESHGGLGVITTLGQKEAEIVCRSCGTHLLGALANLEVPETITICPGFHIVE